MRKLRFRLPVILVLSAVSLVTVLWLVNRHGNDLTPASRAPVVPSTPLIDPLRVCLDAGHGGSDPGTSDLNGTRFEKDDTLALTLAVYERLLAQGIDVFLTREDDSYPTLPERCAMANDDGATLYVSLHRNSGGGAGVEVWVSSDPTPEEAHFGDIVLDALEACGIQRNRGVRRGTPGNAFADFILNSGTNMPSCVIEMGFMDNDIDNRLFDEHFSDYAAAIADSIAAMAL